MSRFDAAYIEKFQKPQKPQKPQNPINLCDWGHETSGEVRLLPHGDNNMICCKLHFQREVNFRRLRNLQLKENCFALPKWEDLKKYES